MLLVFVLFGWSCGSKEPTKQPLRRVDAASVQAAKIPDNGTATHKTLDAHADTPKPRADTDVISWSRMVPIDPVRASKGVVLVDSIRFAIVDCGAVILDHRIHEATKPNRKIARQLKKQCKKISGINQDDVLSGAGISPFLDSLLLNTAGLIAEVRHLEEILSGKLKIPEDAFNREIEARISGCTRHLSDVQRGLEPTRQQLEGEHFDEAELSGLLALLDQPEALIDSVAKLVDIRVISPIWSALMTDVRHNILKGRPAAQLRDKTMLRIVRHRLGRIVSRVEALIRQEGELAHGFDLYLTAVRAYVDRMTTLAETLTTTKDYDERATVLQQLQRIPRDERKSIRDAREFWKQNYSEALAKAAPERQ
jgi:hypothetical protein